MKMGTISFDVWVNQNLSDDDFLCSYFEDAFKEFNSEANDIIQEVQVVTDVLDDIIAARLNSATDNITDQARDYLFWTFLTRGALYACSENYDRAMLLFEKAKSITANLEFQNLAAALISQEKAKRESDNRIFIEQVREMAILNVSTRTHYYPQQV